MKRSWLWVTLMVVASSLLLRAARRKKQARLKQHSPADGASDHHNNKANGAAVVAVNSISESHSTTEKANSKDSDRDRHPERPNDPPDAWRKAEVWFAGTVAFFTFVLSVVSTIQSCIGNKAANAAKESADAEVGANRAWIVPSGIPKVGSNNIDIPLPWTNGGKSPAVHVSGTTEYAMGETNSAQLQGGCEHLKQHNATRSWKDEPVVLPGQPFILGQQPEPLPEDWRKPLTGPHDHRHLWIHGCIWYTDVLTNREGTTEFMYAATKLPTPQVIGGRYEYHPELPFMSVFAAPWRPKGSREMRDALIFH